MIIRTLNLLITSCTGKIHLPPEDILLFPDNHSKCPLLLAFSVVRQSREGPALRAMAVGLREGSRGRHSSLEEADLGLARVRIDLVVLQANAVVAVLLVDVAD